TNTAALDGFAIGVKGFRDTLDDVAWHRRIDLAGQLDEARVHAVAPRCPGQVERIDGNAVSAKAGARIKRLKAERLGFGGGDDFPHVNLHSIENDFQLVYQGDVDRPVRVFEDFARFRDLGTGHRDDPSHRRGV